MITLKQYKPHEGQQAFHYAVDFMWRYTALISGIRGGKTYVGAREALKQAWNSQADGAFLIIAPTYNMLKRTTWMEFKKAAEAFILNANESDKIITLKNNRIVYGFSAEDPDKIRNVTASGFWVDEARECKDFAGLWDVLLGRVLSTNGKGFVTTSPNSFDDIHNIFIENRKSECGTVRFPTYENVNIPKEAIDSLFEQYDEKMARQELAGEFVVFEGQVYYTFRRDKNAGDLAFKVAKYDPTKPINLCCDFNVDPMSWVLAQVHIIDGLKHVFAIDEIYIKNSNTIECCNEFKERYPNHRTGISLYGDASGNYRSTKSHVTDYIIIKDELKAYNVKDMTRRVHPSERDRINSVNGMMCNSRGVRRVQVNPKCRHLIQDYEQVSYKQGTTQIDKSNPKLTHPSDAFGYFIEQEFSLNIRPVVEGLKI